MRRAALSLVLTFLAVAGAAQAYPVIIPVSHAARLQIPGQAGSVVVGDPAVADAIVIDRHTIYVQGKGYGQTEIVVLDREGRTVWQGDVAVVSQNAGRVTMIKGAGSGSGSGSGGGASILGQSSGQGGAQTIEMTCSDVCTPIQAAKPK